MPTTVSIYDAQQSFAMERTRRIYAMRSVAEMTPRASSRLKVWQHLSTQSYAGRGRFAARHAWASRSYWLNA